MSDGSKLRQSWYSALNEAEAEFRQLLTSPAAEWKRLSHTTDSSTPKQKGSSKPRVSLVPELADVVVHRKSSKSGEDVYKMVLDVPAREELVSLEPWKSVLTTPELRQEWDPAVEDAHLVEMFDRSTRIAKTNYTLGWPANPRDSVTISRAFYDSTTLVDITTSLPRSPDEPAYLRPSPPFVRSNVQLFAWCIQYIQSTETSPRRIRTTCFWQHDLKALWGFGTSTAALTQQLSTMTLSLLKTVMKRGGRVPKLAGYGNGISIERIRYQLDREALTVDYAVIPNDEEHNMHQEMGMEEMHHAVREYRRLTRSIECVLPSLEGWDVQVTMKGSLEEVERIPWTAHATRSSSNPSISPVPDQVILRLTHGALTDDDAVLKVKVVIEVSGATRGLRLNGLATKIHDLEERDPSSYALPQKMLQDVASAVDLSIQTSSSLGTVSSSNASSSISAGGLQGVVRPPTVRTPAAEKTILSKVRRNYIYFSSLLQEPEAKWKRTTEARGVSITQLDSIDPTLVVYRAEATFVGVGLWDLYGAVVSPGARVYWDKQHEDGVLLEDVNELTELWHFKTKPAWPVNGRDSVVLKTVYKSPSTIHVFSFSADDPHLFPHIPPAEPNVIRTQVDLQGWAIEALSPTTTLLTLLEQSDPKGWTNKTSIPTQMINTLAGIGEFTIKCGGPPFVTRLAGSKANEIRYDHERGTFKVEYEPCRQRRSNNSSNGSGQQDEGDVPAIECEIRCDVDTWCSSLDIVVDPPPQTISCLRRHRLSVDGGGLWLTLTHDSIFVDDERLLVLVRRAPGKEKGLVMVNGAKVNVDVEELSESEIKALTRQKRVKPPRIPLDQPPVMTVIRRRKAEWTAGEDGEKGNNATAAADASSTTTATISSWASAPKISSPLSRFFTYAVDQATSTTQQAVAAISPANMASANGVSSMDPTKPPMYYALQALAWTQDHNAREGSSSSISSSSTNPGSGSTAATADGWTLVSDKGMTVQRKLIPDISTFIPVHKGFKVIEGVSAEELAVVLTEFDCRKTWDDRYDSARVLETFGGLARTEYVTKKGGFPFRDRGFFLASLVATGDGSTVGGVGSSSSSSSSLRPSVPSTSGGSLGNSGASSSSSSSSSPATNAIYLVSASYSTPTNFDAAKYNPYALPIGRVYIDAWILETLDPYNTKEKYTIPSARCTRLVAVDYGGAVPAAFNGMINAGMARSVLGVEAFVKSGGRKMAIPVMRMPALGFEVVGQAEDEQENKEKEDRGTGSEKTAQVVLGDSARPLVGWTLKKEKEGERRVLVGSTFNEEKKVYRSRVVAHAPASSKVVRSKTKSAEGRMRKEASDATIGATRTSQRESRVRQSALHVQSSSSASTSTSASASHLLASRPRRDRTISDDQISLRSVRSDSTLSPPESGSGPAQDSQVHSDDDDDDDVDYEHMSASTTSILAMPGAMMPGLKAKAAFPTSTVGVGLSSLGRKDAISPQRAGSGARTIKTSMSGSAASPSSGGSTSTTTTPPRLRQRAASSSAGPTNFYGHSRSISHSQSQTTTPRQELSQDPFAPGAGGGSENNFGLGSNLHARARTTSSSVYIGGSSSSLPGSSVIAASMEHRRGREKERENKSKGKGEMVLLEVVVDSRMYSSGYKVDLKARRHDALAIQQHRGGGNAAPIPLLSPLDVGSASTSTSTIGKDDEVLKVPFITHIYTLPSSPLHSSSLAEGDASKNPAVRYLITVSVKTTQIDDSKVEWLDALEGAGLVVDMAVSPLGSIGMVQSKKGKVLVNGVEESVMDEKESLSGLGRERLVDDRLSSVGQLVRFPSEPDRLPEQFQTPVGIADDLLIPSTAPSSSANSNPAPDGSSTSAQGGEGMNGGDIDNDSSGRNGEDSPHTPKLELDRLASGHEMAGGAGTGSGGFLGFLQGYGSLGQFARVGSRRETGVLPVVGDGEDESNSGLQEANTTSTDSSGTGGTAGAATTAVGIARPTTTYSTSTLVFVALIAFLMGSLLRSLLSPADFMYVATEDGTGVESGWREMRRLFEMKYIAGGWDLQVAVVRRRVLE